MDEKTDPTQIERAGEPTLYARYEPKPRPRTVRRVLVRTFVGLVALAALAFVGYQVWQAMHTAPRQTGRFAQTGPQPVGVAAIGKGDVRVIVTALGTVTPLAMVTVRTQINGQLIEVG